MKQPSRSNSHKKHRSRRKKRILSALIVLLLILALVFIAGGILYWRLFGQIKFVGSGEQSYADSLIDDPLDPDYSGTIVSDPVSINDSASSVSDITVQGNTKNITNILLIGVETGGYKTYVGRSDTMLVMSINTYSKTITFTSLMRDIYVEIPGRDKNGDGINDYDKLNAAFAYGGFDLLSKTIETNFRIKIDDYVAVNFQAYSDAVDAMGGIDMKLSGAEAKYCGVGSTDGTYHLNGKAALMYARIRYITDLSGNINDFGRTSRQRAVLQKLLSKAKTMDLASLYSMMYKIFPSISTNMSKNAFATYVLHSSAYLKYDIRNYYLPQENEYENLRVKINGSTADVLHLKDARSTVLALQHEIYG